MEQIDNLIELNDKRKIALEAFEANEKIVIDELTKILNERCCPEGVELVVDLRMDTCWRHDEQYGLYCFTGKVGFKTDNEERLAKGWKTDFGSDFDISIYQNGGIEINKGTCGSYRRQDKFQVARDLCLAKVWENEEALINCMNYHFKYDLYKTFEDINNEIKQIERDIKIAENQRKRAEALQALRGAVYIYTENVFDKYENDDYWSNNIIGKIHRPHDIFKIEKITDKSVLGHYINYSWENKRLDCNIIINRIMNNSLKTSVALPTEFVVLNKEAGK